MTRVTRAGFVWRECGILLAPRAPMYSLHCVSPSACLRPTHFLIVSALGVMFACGNGRQDERPLHDVPPDMAGMVMLVERVPASVTDGDHVAVIFVCEGQETTVIHNAKVIHIAQRDAGHAREIYDLHASGGATPRKSDDSTTVSLIISPGEAAAFKTAVHHVGCTRSDPQYMTLKQLSAGVSRIPSR